MMERATLETVALASGVSKATASKVLNGRAGVSSETRQRVMAVIKRLDYAPSTSRTVAGSTRVVTALVQGSESLYAGKVLSGVIGAGLELGVDVVVADPTGRHRHEPLSAQWLQSVAQKGHVGVIVVTTEVTAEAGRAAAALGLGLVVVDPIGERDARDEGLVSVSATNWTGGYQATSHLLALGHGRIGFAGGRPASQPARQRLHGHMAALAAQGLESDPRLIKQLGFRHEAGSLMAEELLNLDPPPTAIVAGCDASAFGVMATARRRNLRLPEDLSVVGFDDTFAAELAAPKLTTIRQPLREMGRLALRTVLSLVDDGGPETHHFELATTLVVRESTAPPRTRYEGGGKPTDRPTEAG